MYVVYKKYILLNKLLFENTNNIFNDIDLI